MRAYFMRFAGGSSTITRNANPKGGLPDAIGTGGSGVFFSPKTAGVLVYTEGSHANFSTYTMATNLGGKCWRLGVLRLLKKHSIHSMSSKMISCYRDTVRNTEIQ
jgi:hypothetical protein